MEQIGTASGGHPNLNLTPEEKKAYGVLFKEADPDGFGAVSGDVAVKFFERTRLPPDVLGQIWQLADTENRGFLTPAGFGVVLRLIGHAQAGRQPTIQVAQTPAPLPKFDATANQAAPQQAAAAAAAPPPPPPAVQPIVQQHSGTPASPSSAGVRVPTLTPEKVHEYSGLFEKSGAENGFLSGLTAKSIFERARLPNEVLGRIWNLADTQGRGSLDVAEFVIAMHLLASYKSGAMRGVPPVLPPALLDAASRRPPVRLSGGQPAPGRPGSSAGIPPQMQQQYTGRPQSPNVNAHLRTGTPLSATHTGEPWLVAGLEKTKFENIFDSLDPAGQGFITGEQAVQFFSNARLPEEVLAQIWDLADINSDGVLNRDEFSVAMYLIKLQRGSRDGRVPQTLPPALVPPSMRKQVQPSQPHTFPAFDDAPITKPRSAADDLFGLDVMDQPPQQLSAPQQIAQSTGGTDAGPFGNSKAIPAPTSSPPPSTVFKPFVPSSSFGQGLVPQATGSPASAQRKEASLMDEDEAAAPPKINNDAAELGNLSNQVTNLSGQMQNLQTERAQAETELSQTSQQKQAFQQRLTQLRAAYDQEVAQVKKLKEQLATSQAETKRLQSDMAMIGGTHADLATQRQQLAAALAADQQENASLKERIRQTNAETEQLKPQLEKLKSDARQQKGLVAINKKQLATNEAERDRIKAEIAAAQHELDTAKQETEDSAHQVQQSERELQHAKETPIPAPLSRELSPPPQVVSPAPSSSSNPFFRRQDSGATFSPPVGSAITSPVPQHEQERNAAFDSIFGPSAGDVGPAPATSFGRDASADVHAETPQVIEPPSPPQATQLESSALPLRAPLTREDSISSSVQPQPPHSRLSPAHTPRALTPDTSTASPSSQRADDPFASSAVDEEQESIRQTLPRGETSEKLSTLPGAFPRSETPQQDQVNPVAVAAGAGAAAVAVGVGVAAATDAQNKDASGPLPPQNDNFDDFFGGPSHKKTLSEQHADFDSAFAGFDPKPVNGKVQPNNDEFPDIQELADDDDSSDDDSDARGFDDNFAPSSTSAGKQPESATVAPSLAPPAQLETRDSSTSLPGPDSQQSPPGYQDVVPNDNPNHFPQEYKNLLPEREDPTSPTENAAGSSQLPANTPPAYGPEVGSRSQSQSEVVPPTKDAPFDFDTAFASMGTAPVTVNDESDSDYDEHTPGLARSGVADFDPTFDSPAASTRTTNTANTIGLAQSQPFTSAHDAVTSPTANGTSATSPTGPAQASFGDFGEFANSNPFPPSRQQTLGSQQTTSPTSATAAASSHDWDALFAPLDGQKGPTLDEPTAGSGAPLTKVATNSSIQQSTEIGPGLTATTTLDEIPSVSHTPSPQPPAPAIATTAAEPTDPTSSIASHGADQTKLQRPQPGRALSTGTEHDDPILKRLTAMGWSRQESLDALEKFDYNIDKAADFLTFRS